MKTNILLTIVALTLLFACDPNGKEQTTRDKDHIDSTTEITGNKLPAEQKPKTNTETQQKDSSEKETSGIEITEKIPHHFICYKSDTNAAMAISISYDENDKALKVKYKGQDESMALTFLKENYLEGGAHPTIENYYSEIYKGKENGVYKLSHSGIWDYAEYTRSKDGKKFNFTINHELTLENDGYRTTPCF